MSFYVSAFDPAAEYLNYQNVRIVENIDGFLCLYRLYALNLHDLVGKNSAKY